MFKHIVVAYDGSAGAQAALGTGIALAKKAGAKLSTISVKEHLPRYAASLSEVLAAKEEIDEHFRALTKQAQDRAALEGLDLEASVEQGHEVETILDFARTQRADLLAVGSHGHSRVIEHVIGSTAFSVARLASCSVIVVRVSVRGAVPGQIARIAVGLDGSPLGRLAFRTAIDLAILHGATIAGITVREASPLTRPEAGGAAYAEQLALAATEQARLAGVGFEHIARIGHPARAMLEEAESMKADLIVLGATGLEHPWSATLGGTATRVATEASCSVLVVRPGQAALHVRDIMMRGVASVTGDTQLGEVVDLLLRRNVKAVPVLDARRHVVGMITGGDLLERGDMNLRLSVKREMAPEGLRDRLKALARSPRVARDVMTGHVQSVQEDSDLVTVVRLMAERKIKRLPVVNASKGLVGIVSRADVLRAVAAVPSPTIEAAIPALPAMGRLVADAVVAQVPVVAPDTPAEDVLRSILEHPLRRVVIVDSDGRALGLVSDRDLLSRSTPDSRSWLLRVLSGGPWASKGSKPAARQVPKHWGPLTAADLMGPLLVTVRPEDSLTHAVRLMMQHQIKRLVVVDDQGRFRGLVDRREVLRLLAGESA
jgi:nucleotide-binding universal stress UspA family protein/CBS-domain-containing membrane protein